MWMTMDRTSRPARSHSARKCYSLRSTLPAPGAAAWGGLPERDRAVLRWLVVGDVLTSELAALLAYGSLRTARRRLARMSEHGLLRGFWAANSQRPRGRYAYALVSSVRDELARAQGSGVRRRVTAGPRAMTIHQLATNDVMAAFLRDARPAVGLGLAAWLPERTVAPLFDRYVVPDALAVIGTPSDRICLVIERDLGTEPTTTVASKVARYTTLFAGQADGPVNVGIVVESTRRLTSVRRAIGRAAAVDTLVWVTTSGDLLADPYGANWLAPDGRRRPTVNLPGEPVIGPPVVGVQCLLDVDGAEAFEFTATEPVLALRRFMGRR